MNAADLQRIDASRGWRDHRIEIFRGTSVGDVLVKGQRPAQGAWRYRLANALARATGLSMLAGDTRAFGEHAQRNEVERLRALSAAGVDVPALLHVGPSYFVLQFVPGRQLTELLRGEQAGLWWQRGLDWIADLHRRGQYLSQAFARNFIVDGERLVAIDFESDPARFMPLEAAQARDWLAYLFSSMNGLPLPRHEAAARLRAALAVEPPTVRAQLDAAAGRMAWVLRLPREGPRGGWRRHVASVQAVVAAILEAQAPVAAGALSAR
jgi:hypothetical protein